MGGGAGPGPRPRVVLLPAARWQLRAPVLVLGLVGQGGASLPKGRSRSPAPPPRCARRRAGRVGGPAPSPASRAGASTSRPVRRRCRDRGCLWWSGRRRWPRRCWCLARGARRGTGPGGPRQRPVPTVRHGGDRAARGRLQGRVRAGSSAPCSAWVGSFRGRRSKLFGWLGNVPTGTKGVKPPGVAPGRPVAIDTSQAPRAPPPFRALPAREQPPARTPAARRVAAVPRQIAAHVPGRLPGGDPDRAAVPCNSLARWRPRAGPNAAEQVRRSCQRSGPHRPCRTTGAWGDANSQPRLRCCPEDSGPQRPPRAVRVLARRGCAGWRTTTPSRSV